MQKITKEFAVKTLRKLVAERGEDYVYPIGECRYWDQDKNAPSCAVGVVLFEAGYPPEEIQDLDPKFQTSRLGVSAGELINHEFSVTPKAQDILVRFQERQDIGTPYGEALRYALR